MNEIQETNLEFQYNKKKLESQSRQRIHPKSKGLIPLSKENEK